MQFEQLLIPISIILAALLVAPSSTTNLAKMVPWIV